MSNYPNFSKERYKELLVKTMAEFIKFCNRNDIEYIGAYGTVLGAIRHKGLIPWDDDIDVFMTRDNYEKFLKLKDGMKGSGYEIVDIDDEGYYLPFAKFCDTNTSIWEVENLPFVLGVFIDVFPLDYVEEDDTDCVKLRNEYMALFDKYLHSLKTFRIKDVFSFGGFKSFLKAKFYKMTVSRKSVRAMEHLIRTKQGPFRMYYRSLDKYTRSKFESTWFDECIEVPYEDISIRIPKEYDKFLAHCYGDYMTPPPKEKQVSQHYHYFVDLEKRLTIEEIKRIKNGK